MSLHRKYQRAFPDILFMFMMASGLTHRSLGAAIPAAPMSTAQPGTGLVFYAPPDTNEDLWPALFQALRADLADGGGELSGGVVLDNDPLLVRADQDLRGMTFPRVVTVKLLGRCDLLPQTNHPQEKGPLGWVLLVSGRVQPFISIDCTRIAQVLRPAAAGWSQQRCQGAMAQAIAHVLIHEWWHIATQSAGHASRGITQANLSVSDLIKEPSNRRFSARIR